MNNNKILTLLVSYWTVFSLGWIGYKVYDHYDRKTKQPIVYPVSQDLSQEDDLIARQHILEKEQREREAGERLMEQHKLKHEAIEARLNDKKR